ncbi:hypothetical protein PV797_01360 [Clostridiaceae bacterium M8S5]|nr:hypothetical protein PV797_01360 [Clostridiaceae bacterium M8S5]
MKKKIYIAIALVLVVFSCYKLALHEIEHNKIKKYNQNIKKFIEPYINNTSFIVNNDKYIFRVDKVESDIIKYEHEKNEVIQASIYYNIYKNNEIEDNLIENEIITFKFRDKSIDDSRDKFILYKKQNRTIQYELFKDTVDAIIDKFGQEYEQKHGIDHIGGMNGHGYYNEDFDVNLDMELSKAGYCKYQLIEFTKVFSFRFTTDKFLLKDMKDTVQIPVKMEYVTGNYHPLWDMKITDIDDVTVDGINMGKDKALKVIKLLKDAPFTLTQESFDSNDTTSIELIYGDRGYYFDIGEDVIYTSRANAICKGKEYVDKLKAILKIND